VGPPGFEPGFAGLSAAPLQQVIILHQQTYNIRWSPPC